MPARPVRVALLDTGLSRAAAAGCQRYLEIDAEGGVRAGQPLADVGHGDQVLGLLQARDPALEVLAIQVMDGTVEAGATRLVTALRWLLTQPVDLVNLSLGLRVDRRLLREAVAALCEQGRVVFAAAPARGGPVYPAAYPGVIAVSGDARCGPGQHSHLGSGGVDFGASTTDAAGRPGGASLAVPRLCAAAARFLGDGGEPGRVYQHLRATADFHGRERRSLEA